MIFTSSIDGYNHPVLVFGNVGDIPVPKVYYGATTMATFGVRNDASATYYLATATGGIYAFGSPGDVSIQRPVGQ